MMKMKIKFSLALLSGVLVLVSWPANPALAAGDGSLTVNNQAIYDNGRTNGDGTQAYEIKTLWGKDRDQANQQQMKTAQQIGQQADAMTFKTNNQSPTQSWHQAQLVLAKHLFTKDAQPAGPVTTSSVPRKHHELMGWLGGGLLLILSLVLGSLIGRQFGHYRQRGGKDGNRS